MKYLKQFNISFLGLKEGSNLFEYQIDNSFFEDFNFKDFNQSNLKVEVYFTKNYALMDLFFSVNGTVNIPCDITNKPYNQDINGEMKLAVKFGSEFNDEHDEILIIPHDAYQVNVAQYIYELIILSVPTKRIHPDVLNGSMESETLKILDKLSISVNKLVEQDTSTDPRWDKLKNLQTDK